MQKRTAGQQNGEKRSANTGAVGNPDGSAITPSPTSSNAALRSELSCPDSQACDGTIVRSWYCSSPTAAGCFKVGIREVTLKTLIADVMGLPDFDEELFNQQLAYATVPADNEIVFHFRDGHEASRIFVQKRQMPTPD